MEPTSADIAPGDVFLLQCTLCDPPKPKFFVVAQASPLRMFLINSKLTSFAMGQPAIVAASPLIRAESNPFLRYDSYVACNHLSHEYSSERLGALLAENPSIRKGHLCPLAKASVAGALRMNELIARKYLRDLRPIWDVWGGT